MSTLSRRTLLRGAAALGVAGGIGGVALAACGDDDGDSATSGDPEPGSDSGNALVAFFDGPSSLVAGEVARAPFGIGDQRGALVKDTPERLAIQVLDADDEPVADAIEVRRRNVGLPRAYYPLTFTPAVAGVYTARAVVDDETLEAAFQVAPPGTTTAPRAGQPMTPVDTPSRADARGVDPICTNQPQCRLHDTDLRTTLAARRPLAVLVSTPAFCATAICGPVLDVLLDAQAGHPEVQAIHVEVYRSGTEAADKGANATLAPAVDALNLTYEPCLFLVSADGRVAQRLDVIFDRSELDEGLSALIS